MFCPAVSRNGRRCDFAKHPGAVHWSWVEGELQHWQALPEVGERWVNLPATEDPLRDGPQALISDAVRVPPELVGDFNPLEALYRDPQLALRCVQLMTNPTPEEPTMSNSVQDLLARGRQLDAWSRPVVEATTVGGRFTYGLLEANAEPFGYHLVDETVPESGGIPAQQVVHPDSLREVLVPGHRGGCAGDCCREGYSEDTSYPECWTWDLVRDGTAEKFRAWKDWVL
jgi:hypothetical protein